MSFFSTISLRFQVHSRLSESIVSDLLLMLLMLLLLLYDCICCILLSAVYLAAFAYKFTNSYAVFDQPTRTVGSR